MKSILLSFVLIVLSSNVIAQSADEIIDYYFEIIGGKEQFNAIESITMTGKAQMQGIELPMMLVMKKPNKSYQEINFQGKKIINAFNGTVGWTINPLAMAFEAQKLPEDQLSQFEDQSVEDILLNYRSNGHEVISEGVEDIQGTSCYKVKLTMNNGDIQYHFFDVESGIKIMQRAFVKSGPAAGQSAETYFSEYDQVSGIYFPFSMETQVSGQTIMQMSLDTIEINKGVSDSLFEFPRQ